MTNLSDCAHSFGSMSQTEILGEQVEILQKLLPYLKTRKNPNGTYNVIGERIPAEVVTPFWRALMRREAQMLEEDASDPTESGLHRTPDQRRADAFLDLILMITDNFPSAN